MAYIKDFDTWTQKKKKHNADKVRFASPGEIWWCALGVNVGSEVDGKNDLFERPVIALQVYNKDTLFVVPTGTTERSDFEVVPVVFKNQNTFALIRQGRVISSKRLLRKIDILDPELFTRVRKAFLESFRLTKRNPAQSAGNLGGRET
jgi:mRNA-degrading endonuclease toxin of MazEF toxin-antitoxin module